MSTRDLWNRYARYFNAEEGSIFPQDIPELNFYRSIREEYTGLCLEIGAGSGRLAASLKGEQATLALEPSDIMLNSWSHSDCEEVFRVQGAGEILPFRTDSFQLVCFPYNGLQCVPEEKTRMGILKEAFRVVSPGGYFLFEVSPIFARRDSEPLTKRYSAAMPDGSRLILREKVERKRNPDSLKYYMFYTTLSLGSETTEEITLDMAVMHRDHIISLIEQTGFTDITEWGDYDRSPYNDELSPRLLVLAKKGV